ncbi:restriction endonuclease [Acholeplasma laidlawii]|uniref:restriction endonuclease n=1 Tax=Acholeplasma laidlawii TaxID=2148 RepID=UPI0025415A80|nr:restriction endonuclease [Acholeplasma laidlawii]
MPLIDQLKPHDFEKIIAETYKRLGFRVKITKRSHDYGVDVFAEKGEDKICIQAKLYLKQKVNLKAIQKIYTAKGIYKCNTAVVITNAKFQKSATISANKLQVLLIGRKRLLKNLILTVKKLIPKERNPDYKLI